MLKMMKRNNDFRDSIQELAKDVGVEISDYQKDPEKAKQEKSEKEKVKLINKRMQSVFSSSFDGSKAAIYCNEKRKLTPETIKTFGLWYAPDSHYELVSMINQEFSMDLIKQKQISKNIEH